MQITVQSVINNFSKVTAEISKKVLLHVSLIMMTKERKNYKSLACSNSIPYKKVYITKEEVSAYSAECSNWLIKVTKELSTPENPGYLIVDFSMITKQFSQYIPNVTYDYDGVTKSVSKGLSVGTIFWSNGKVTIPFHFAYWHSRKDAGEHYVPKLDIVKQLLEYSRNIGIRVYEVKLDGAFASEESIKYLKHAGIHFTMRIPSNRVISNERGAYQLKKHPGLQLQRNQKFKTICASYKEVQCYFTVEKRNGKNGTKECVFIVSDIERAPVQHVLAYKKRWPCEKYFRTSKQYLGLKDCQSTDENKQKLHIFLVMTSYAILELERIYKKKKSIEEILHKLRYQKQIISSAEYLNLEPTLMH